MLNHNHNTTQVKIKIVATAGNRIRELLYRCLERYRSAAETTENIDWSKKFKLFQRNESKDKQTKSTLRAKLFQLFNKVVFCSIVIFIANYIIIFSHIYGCRFHWSKMGLKVRFKLFCSKYTGIVKSVFWCAGVFFLAWYLPFGVLCDTLTFNMASYYW